jgi:mitochondrial fission protein ELM1
MENQCLGLAEAVGCTPVVKRVTLRGPWRRFSPYLPVALPLALALGSDPLAPPWPDLLITSGRQSVGPALAIRRAAAKRGGGKAGGGDSRPFWVHIQNPGIPARLVDLIVLPRHDGRPPGGNVLTTTGALHRVTPARLAESAARFAPALAHLPRPRVAVLIGGSNGVYDLTAAVTRDLAAKLAALARDRGVGLMVTPSRRTGAENEAILRDALAGLPAVVWDGTGENPYFGYLGLADAVIATCDSVSMISEAISTGKPVHVIELAGGSAKFRRFQEMLYADGTARPFTGALEHWACSPPDDTARVAAVVRERMAAGR